MTYNIHIYAYGDLDFARSAVLSVPPGVPIRVFDGRHAEFGPPDLPDVTPGLEAFCNRTTNVEYYAPPSDLLPFGTIENADKRESGYEKSRFVFDNLPPSEWTLKLDTDDILRKMSFDFDNADPTHRYIVSLDSTTQGAASMRLFKPEYWTPYIGDCLLPRTEYPRDISLEAAHKAWQIHRLNGMGEQYTEDIRIENRGHERPNEYQRYRIDQLIARNRLNRARQLQAELQTT